MQIDDIQEEQDNKMIAALPHYFKGEININDLESKGNTQRFSAHASSHEIADCYARLINGLS